jgi:transposase-like protein
MDSPRTLQQAILYFSIYDNCRAFLASLRWQDGRVRCPTCDNTHVVYLAKARVYKCYGKHPRPKFSLKTGTIFEDSPLGLEKWLPALWLVVNAKNGISSCEIARSLGVTQKTAWFMAHRLRFALAQGSFDSNFGASGGAVEVDETFVGGETKNRHLSKRQVGKYITDEHGIHYRNPDYKSEAGLGTKKTPVMGMLDRELREVRAKVVPNVSRETLQDAILANIEGGSTVYTDSAKAYHSLPALDYIHAAVNHAEEYVRGNVHVNGLENFWALLKRGLKGTYVSVEAYHLDRYLTEQVFRYNNRATKGNPLTDGDRFVLAASMIVGKRLTWKNLTGKDSVN